MTNRFRTLWWILLGSFVLRLGSVPLVHTYGYRGDEAEYISMARNMAHGGEFVDSNGERSARSPLFPIALAGIFSLIGDGLIIPHLLECFLGTLVVALTYLLCLRLFENAAIAAAAAIAAGLYPGLIVYSALLQTETLFIVFFLLVFLIGYRILEKPSLAAAIMLGLVGGLAALTRAIFLGVFPLILLSISWIWYRKGHKRIAPAALCLLAFCAVISPWTLRNYSIHHEFVPISTWSGRSLLIANNPFATGTWSVKNGFEPWLEQQLHARGIESATNLPETELSNVSRDIALGYIASHPGESALLAVKRAHIFSFYPITHSDSYLPLQGLAAGCDFFLLLVAVVGLVASWDRRSTLTPLFWSFAVFFTTHTIIQAEARYRLPLIPLLCLFAGVGFSTLTSKGQLQEVLGSSKKRTYLAALASMVVVVYGYTGWLFLSGKV